MFCKTTINIVFFLLFLTFSLRAFSADPFEIAVRTVFLYNLKNHVKFKDRDIDATLCIVDDKNTYYDIQKIMNTRSSPQSLVTPQTLLYFESNTDGSYLSSICNIVYIPDISLGSIPQSVILNLLKSANIFVISDSEILIKEHRGDAFLSIKRGKMVFYVNKQNMFAKSIEVINIDFTAF